MENAGFAPIVTVNSATSHTSNERRRCAKSMVHTLIVAHRRRSVDKSARRAPCEGGSAFVAACVFVFSSASARATSALSTISAHAKPQSQLCVWRTWGTSVASPARRRRPNERASSAPLETRLELETVLTSPRASPRAPPRSASKSTGAASTRRASSAPSGACVVTGATSTVAVPVIASSVSTAVVPRSTRDGDDSRAAFKPTPLTPSARVSAPALAATRVPPPDRGLVSRATIGCRERTVHESEQPNVGNKQVVEARSTELSPSTCHELPKHRETTSR